MEKTLIKMQFDPKIAKKIGVEEAIMFSNIEYWIEKNKANNKHFYDGYYWTYNSQMAFCKLFPFWTRNQIRRILDNLSENGYIVIGNYNKSSYDKTSWFRLKHSLVETHQSKRRNPPIEASKSTNRSVEIHQPIPNNKPNSKPNGKLRTTAKSPKADFAEVESIPNLKQGHPIKNQKKLSVADKVSAGIASDEEIVSEIIFKFKSINPLIKYNNKTERSCAQELLDKFGKKSILELVDFAVFVQGKEFAPTITTPFELSKKIGRLKVYYEREKNKQGNGLMGNYEESLNSMREKLNVR